MPILPTFSLSIRGVHATVLTSVVAMIQQYSPPSAERPHAADAAAQPLRARRRPRAGTGGPAWRSLRLPVPRTEPGRTAGCAGPGPRAACPPRGYDVGAEYTPTT